MAVEKKPYLTTVIERYGIVHKIVYTRFPLKDEIIVEIANYEYKDGELRGAKKRGYMFTDVGKQYDSPYLNDENVGCSALYSVPDLPYMKQAVQRGHKLCAAMPLNTPEEIHQIIDYLPENVICVGDRPELDKSGFFLIIREGKLTDYFDLDRIFEIYRLHKVRFNEEEIRKVAEQDMIDIVKCPYGNDVQIYYNGELHTFSHSTEVIVRGLLLGYTLESTVSFLNDRHFS